MRVVLLCGIRNPTKRDGESAGAPQPVLFLPVCSLLCEGKKTATCDPEDGPRQN